MSHGYTMTLFIMSGLILACASSPAHGESAPGGPGYQTVLRGTFSGVRGGREVLIESDQAFERLWLELHAGRSPVPRPPHIDFERSQVVAVFAGEKPTGGHSIEVTGVQQEGEYRVVLFEQRGPSPGDIVTQVLTQPFHMVQFPRAETEVRFRSRTASGSE